MDVDALNRAVVAEAALLGPKPTRRQVATRIGIVLTILAIGVGWTIHARQPDPFTTTEVAVWERPIISPDGQTVTVSYQTGVCGDQSVKAEVEETSTTVTLTVTEVIRWADDDIDCPSIGVVRNAAVQLVEPLGDRKLVDGSGLKPPR